jgi:hypothetical protein
MTISKTGRAVAVLMSATAFEDHQRLKLEDGGEFYLNLGTIVGYEVAKQSYARRAVLKSAQFLERSVRENRIALPPTAWETIMARAINLKGFATLSIKITV